MSIPKNFDRIHIPAEVGTDTIQSTETFDVVSACLRTRLSLARTNAVIKSKTFAI